MIRAAVTMTAMKRALLGLVFLSACSSPPPQPPSAPPGPAPAGIPVGLPGEAPRTFCDASGRWSASGHRVEHRIEPEGGDEPAHPSAGSPRLSLFRGTLPFPQVTWDAGGGFQVTQLLYPAGPSGVVARYHVMNHGDEPRSCRLVVASGGLVPSGTGASRTASGWSFPLRVEPGTSAFVHLTTADLAGRVQAEDLERAAAAWERAFEGRRLRVPDADAVTEYYAALAGIRMGLSERAAVLDRLLGRLARPEGGAIRLFPDVPEAWLYQTIEAEGIPTPFGALTVQYEGAFNARALELRGDCRPPQGFLLEAPAELSARIDGRPAAPSGGLLRIPAGARRIELVRPS
jgi:hypothetical protein